MNDLQKWDIFFNYSRLYSFFSKIIPKGRKNRYEIDMIISKISNFEGLNPTNIMYLGNKLFFT